MARKILQKNSTFFIFLLLFFGSTSSAATQELLVDVYKTNQISTKDVKDKFKKELTEILNLLKSPNTDNELKASSIKKLKTSIISGIHSMGNFAYVDVSPITYPASKRTYFTIDIVDNKDIKRIPHFLKVPTQTIPDPGGTIKKWAEYESLGFTILMNGKEKNPLKFTKCPTNHCIFGFDHDDLKKYKIIFDTLVRNNKQELVSILRNDRDEDKRASSALLLAHLENSKEVIELLTASIFDPSRKVRNDAMRVIGGTLSSNKSLDFPIDKALIALDLPAETDRNKALMIIEALIEKPNNTDYISKHAAFTLIDHLKLLQPNLHDLSYNILKKISGKKFTDRDYASWEQWALTMQKKAHPGYRNHQSKCVLRKHQKDGESN